MEFHDGEIAGVVVRPLARRVDARGSLTEAWRSDELPPGLRPAMGYLSMTEPGVTRGPHEHHRQTDLFTFPGPGRFLVVLWDNREASATRGARMRLVAGDEAPVTLLVPPGVVHAYRNIHPGESGLVLNAPDALFAGPGRREAVDEVRHEVDGNPFHEDFRRS